VLECNNLLSQRLLFDGDVEPENSHGAITPKEMTLD